MPTRSGWVRGHPSSCSRPALSGAVFRKRRAGERQLGQHLELGLCVHFRGALGPTAKGLHWVPKEAPSQMSLRPTDCWSIAGEPRGEQWCACADSGPALIQAGWLHASSGDPAFPGKPLAFSITSIHLERGARQDAQGTCLGSTALPGHLTVGLGSNDPPSDPKYRADGTGRGPVEARRLCAAPA